MPAFSLSETLDVMDNLESAGLPLRAVKAYMRLCNDGPLTKKSLAARFKQTETAVAGWLRALVGLGFVVEVGGVFRVAKNFFSLDVQSINVSMPIVQEKTNGTEKDVTPREAVTEPEINFSALAEEAAEIMGRGVSPARLVMAIRNAARPSELPEAAREHFPELVRMKAAHVSTQRFRSPGGYFYTALKQAIIAREWERTPEVAPPRQRTPQTPSRNRYERPSNVILQRENKDDRYYDHIMKKFG